nr:hypothetical protein VIGAN_01132700 [Ipomoea batatas]
MLRLGEQPSKLSKTPWLFDRAVDTAEGKMTSSCRRLEGRSTSFKVSKFRDFVLPYPPIVLPEMKHQKMGPNWEKKDDDENNDENNGNASALSGFLLNLTGFLELLGTTIWPRPCSWMAFWRNDSLSPLAIRFSIRSSSGCSPVTVKYRRATVSLYSEFIRARRAWKSSIMTFSFLPSPPTTAVRVRSVEEPGPHPDTWRDAALDFSRASSLALMTLTRFKTCATSPSILDLKLFMVFALWAVLHSSFNSCNFL